MTADRTAAASTQQRSATRARVATTRVRKPAAERLEEILAKSCDILVEEGYAAFNLRRVAAAVGVRLGAVQYYFPTREALLAATIERWTSMWGATYKVILNQRNLAPEQRIGDIQNLGVEAQYDPSASLLLYELYALSGREEFVRQILRRDLRIYRKRLAKVLGEIRGDLSEGELMAFASILVAQWEGLSFFTQRDDIDSLELATIRDVLGQTLESFFRSLRDYRPARLADDATPRGRNPRKAGNAAD